MVYRKLMVAFAALLLGCLLVLGGILARGLGQRPMLLLPMVSTLGDCLLAKSSDDSLGPCGGVRDSAHRLVELSLNELGPAVSPDGRYRLGYTLNVPLLRLFERDGNGGWVVRQQAVQRVVNTIQSLDRPVLMYLFSNHFEVKGDLERELASDPSNLAQTPAGVLPIDKYYTIKIYPWTVARHDNSLTRRRQEAIAAVLKGVCALPYEVRQRLVGVTVLGETHQLFPGFETGMGWDVPYQVSDYSATSKADFRQYLQRRFGSVAKLNEGVAADYGSFDEVQPPALDIRRDRLTRYQDHIDAFAAGVFPVSGWVHVPPTSSDSKIWIRVYLNGRQIARVPVNQGRQDVLEALPALGTADVGWRHDIDFRALPTGLHRVDVALERAEGQLEHLGVRHVGVLDRTQASPQHMPMQALPDWVEPSESTRFSVDMPKDHMSVYYNPLVPIWHEFRAEQVTRYLAYMAKPVQDSCVPRDAVFTHQIVPFTNPSWDESRFAVRDSLSRRSGMALGISLYGDPIYGQRVLDWRESQNVAETKRWPTWDLRVRPYGITEFHPLKPLSEGELDAALTAHQRAGARFASFFMEVRWSGGRVWDEMNMFSLDPDNHPFGSDVLYRSFSGLLHGTRRADGEQAR